MSNEPIEMSPEFEAYLKDCTDQELEEALSDLYQLQTVAVGEYLIDCQNSIRAIRAEQAIRPTERFLREAFEDEAAAA